MKTLFFLSLFVLAASAQGQINFEAPACGPRLSTLEKASRNAKPAYEVLNQAIDKDTRVLIFGEDHDEYASKEELVKVYSGIKEKHPELNCIFLEIGNEHQSLLDKFLKGEMTTDELLKEIVRLNYNGKPYTEEYVNMFTKRVTPWLKLAQEAHADGASVFFLDVTAEELRQFYYKKIHDTAPRNEAFAERMQKLFDSHQCQLSMMPIGYQHVNFPTPELETSKDTRLQSFVRAKGTKALAINFTNTTYEVNGPFFFLNYDFESYMGYIYGYEMDPDSALDRERMKKFNDKEINCVEKAKKLLPSDSVIIEGNNEILPAFGAAGIMSAPQAGKSAYANQVDFWLWVHHPQIFKEYPKDL